MHAPAHDAPLPFWQGKGYLPTYLDFLLREISPGLSRQAMTARVTALRAESADALTVTLRPPRRWRGFTPGMFLPVDFPIDGVLVRRCYSITSAPAHYRRHGLITITIKRVAGGKVSHWAHDGLRAGDWLNIGEAAGEFTLKRTSSDKLLFLAAGSGITPFFSMLQSLADSPEAPDIVLLQYGHHPHDLMFDKALTDIAAAHARFTRIPVLTGRSGRISAAQLLADCPDLRQREAFLCGPAGFMTTAARLLAEHGVRDDRIFRESFGFRPDNMYADAAQASAVHFTRSRVRVQGDGSKTLLELAEQAGLRPRHGCRAGLCHSCTCTKTAGLVMDIRDGRRSSPDRQDIQACIAVPIGPVDVEL